MKRIHYITIIVLSLIMILSGGSVKAFGIARGTTRAASQSFYDNAGADASLYRQWQKLPSSSLREMGFRYIGIPDSTKIALICYSILANRLDTIDPKSDEGKQCISAINNLGFIYAFRFRDYGKAQQYILEAIDLYEENGFNEFLPMAYLNLASIYAYIDLYYLGRPLSDETIRLYRKALDESDKTGNDDHYLKVMNAFIDAMVQSGTPAPLDIEYKRFAEKKPRNRNNAMWNFTRGHLAAARMLRVNPAKSIENYKRLLNSTQGLPDSMLLKLSVMEGLALAQVFSGDNNAAISTLEAAVVDARQAGLKEELVTIYKKLSDLYGDNGDVKKHDNYHLQYLLAKDSVMVNFRMRDVANRKIVEDLSERDRKITELSYQKKISGLRLTAVLAITILISGFLVYFIAMNIKLRHRNRELYLKNLANLELEKSLTDLRNSREPENAAPDKTESASAYANSNLTAEDKDRIVERVERFLSQSNEIFSCDYKLSQLAGALGISTQHLSQALNEYGGKNFYTLLGEYRIREACRRMQNKDYVATRTVETIAQEVGIKSRSNFTSLFKNFTGLTPSQYIKAASM